MIFLNQFIKNVGYENENLRDQAYLLIDKLADSWPLNLSKEADCCLFVTQEKLTLKLPGFSLLYADFSPSAKVGKKHSLMRACKPQKGLKIIDATAGWGRDSALLASFGAEVLMLERHPIMAALLADALERRAQLNNNTIGKLVLKETEAYSYLSYLEKEEYPDVIYLDPMHPVRNKSALVKKDMQALQQMIGMDEGVLELIQLARTRVKQRVVVKWPQKLKALLPTFSCIEGKTVRFDIYSSEG